jgi:hypothetical protein
MTQRCPPANLAGDRHLLHPGLRTTAAPGIGTSRKVNHLLGRGRRDAVAHFSLLLVNACAGDGGERSMPPAARHVRVGAASRAGQGGEA